ncbi:hypothetical protein AVEN_263557-1 [Araneus ventricosus]|uniref:Uncharacterized protein n=1 Tax=Araneus ventricosus TaxID=182803 RepID=A0A4Y2S0R2_ARAVE|nr:hypothetical protein AVEN_263557-1 [Araneus ventricosus]
MASASQLSTNTQKFTIISSSGLAIKKIPQDWGWERTNSGSNLSNSAPDYILYLARYPARCRNAAVGRGLRRPSPFSVDRFGGYLQSDCASLMGNPDP